VRVIEPGKFRLFVGGSQPDARSVELTGQAPLSVDVELTGERRELPY
jgi:beta-glucosidase